MTNASELLPCPFCGGTDLEAFKMAADANDATPWFIECYNCETSGPRSGTEADAITAWNTRQVTQLEAQLAEVRAAAVTFVNIMRHNTPQIDDALTIAKFRKTEKGEEWNSVIPWFDEMERLSTLLIQSKEPK